jgi:hypothetical protein
MENKNLTAVDWYFDKMKSHFEHDGDLYEVACMTYQLAKEKEKEQIENAYNTSFRLRDKPYQTAEKYYNETYKQD